MLEFILDRYNYWIFIVLMMVGLYTVISRGNLVKKVIGLNLFQTSVFIFYISIGKIAGGTAPILIGDHGGDHGGGHGGGPDGDEGSGDHSAVDRSGAVDRGAADGGDAHASAGESESLHADYGANPVDVAAAHEAPEAAGTPVEGLHHADAANQTLAANADEPGFEVTAIEAEAASVATVDAGHGAAAAGEIIYTNPLPHVLILTAIVVGVATTAVGLALAVRIREAYGTIEEDELEAADNVAEFGDAFEGAEEARA